MPKQGTHSPMPYRTTTRAWLRSYLPPGLRRSRLFGQLPGKNKLKAWSRLPDFTIPRNQNHPVLFRRAVKLVEQPPTCGQGGGNALRFPGLSIGTALARSGGDRRSRLSTNSQHLLGMASGG